MQELTLKGLVSEVEVTVVDAESLRVEDSLVHKCTFPVRELLGRHLRLNQKNFVFVLCLVFNDADWLLW